MPHKVHSPLQTTAAIGGGMRVPVGSAVGLQPRRAAPVVSPANPASEVDQESTRALELEAELEMRQSIQDYLSEWILNCDQRVLKLDPEVRHLLVLRAQIRAMRVFQNSRRLKASR